MVFVVFYILNFIACSGIAFMTRNGYRIHWKALIAGFFLCSCHVVAAQRSDDKAPPQQSYTDTYEKMLQEIAKHRSLETLYPNISSADISEIKIRLRQQDTLAYAPEPSLQPKNIKISLEPFQNEMPIIKVGHNFIASLVFTDAAGNPWSAETLRGVSNSNIVSVDKAAEHIVTITPKVRAGQANIPILLRGSQRPITFLIEVSDKEAYFTVDVQVNGLGDSEQSQTIKSITQYSANQQVEPKLSTDPAKAQMLQRVTPDGYKQLRIFDEYRQPVDPRDFLAWEYEGKIYLLTRYQSFVPDPVDISASTDGVYNLYEYPKLPIINVRKNSTISSLRIE
jgi:Putative outer membrane core complex of type IVb secretion